MATGEMAGGGGGVGDVFVKLTKNPNLKFLFWCGGGEGWGLGAGDKRIFLQRIQICKKQKQFFLAEEEGVGAGRGGRGACRG